MHNMLETIAANPSLRILRRALEIAGLEERLTMTGPHTFFAPADAAFDRLNLEELLVDRPRLTEVLLYHLVSEQRQARELDVVTVDTLLTELGRSLSVYFDENAVMIDNAHIVEGDIECNNGLIHIIDNVFLPQYSGWYETLA